MSDMSPTFTFNSYFLCIVYIFFVNFEGSYLCVFVFQFFNIVEDNLWVVFHISYHFFLFCIYFMFSVFLYLQLRLKYVCFYVLNFFFVSFRLFSSFLPF